MLSVICPSSFDRWILGSEIHISVPTKIMHFPLHVLLCGTAGVYMVHSAEHTVSGGISILPEHQLSCCLEHTLCHGHRPPLWQSCLEEEKAERLRGGMEEPSQPLRWQFTQFPSGAAGAETAGLGVRGADACSTCVCVSHPHKVSDTSGHWTMDFSSSLDAGLRKMGFPGDLDGKESSCNAEDPGLIPGSGRSHGVGNGNPLPYPCLENPMDRGAWWATVYGTEKDQTWLRD